MGLQRVIFAFFLMNACQSLRDKNSDPGSYIRADLPKEEPTKYTFDSPNKRSSFPNDLTIVAQHSKKCLAPESLENGARILQASCDGRPNQRFELLKQDDDSFQIRSKYSKKCFDIKEKSNENGVLVHQWDCYKSTSQSIVLNYRSYSKHSFGLQFQLSGKCLDIIKGSKEDGAASHQWSCFDVPFSSQTFYLDSMQDVSKEYKKKNLAIPIHLGLKPIPPFMLNTDSEQSRIDAFISQSEQGNLRKEGDIYIVFIDTLRWDYVQRLAPNISKFLASNIGGKLIACSAGTYHATYSFMHSQSCQYMPDIVQNSPRSTKQSGAIFLRALHKFGYEIEGIGEYLTCVDEVESSTWNKNLESYFGYETKLLHQCRGGKNYSKDLAHAGYSDGQVIDETIRHNKQTSKDERTLYYLYLYSTHATYKWNTKLNVDNSLSFVTTGDLFSQDQPLVESGYINAIRSVDYEFQRLIDYLKSSKKYDQSTIIIVGDHGEMLGEKPNYELLSNYLLLGTNGKGFNHGINIYRENIETIIGYKFPKKVMDSLDLKRIRMNAHVFSPLDMVPTLMDGLGLSGFASEYFAGNSLLSPSYGKKSAVSIEALFWKPSQVMALVSDQHKIFIKFDSSSLDEYLKQDSFTIIDITDLNDRSVWHEGVYGAFGIEGNGVVKDKAGLIKQIKAEFSDALSSIFSANRN